MKRITNIIKNKYYTYQPGEFMPVYMDGELSNRRSFHIYKARRAAWRVQLYLKAVHYQYKQAQTH